VLQIGKQEKPKTYQHSYVFLAEANDFSQSYRPAMGPTQPPIKWVPATFFRRVKRTEREGDHSHVFSAEIKNGGVLSPLPHMS
jgi:hypothetical protein